VSATTGVVYFLPQLLSLEINKDSHDGLMDVRVEKELYSKLNVKLGDA
jgi:hypothetical protein